MNLNIRMLLPVLKLRTRQFHVTSKLFLRKIAPKTLSNDEDTKFLRETCDSSLNGQTCSPDYLGIEKDEGVIVINPLKHSLPQAVPSTRVREKFYHASFGVIRYDSDNKLKSHGQYENNVDFTFPYHSREDVEVKKNSRNCNSTINQDRSVKNLKSSYDIEKLNCDSNYKLPSSEKKGENANFIDDCYFNNSEKDLIANCDMNQTVSDVEMGKVFQRSSKSQISQDPSVTNSICNEINNDNIDNLSSFENNNQNVSCIDEYYFGVERFSHSDMRSKTTEELNFIDNDYFETLSNSKNSMEQDASKHSISMPENDYTSIESHQHIFSEETQSMNNEVLKNAVSNSETTAYVETDNSKLNDIASVQNSEFNAGEHLKSVDFLNETAVHFLENNNLLKNTINNEEKNKSEIKNMMDSQSIKHHISELRQKRKNQNIFNYLGSKQLSENDTVTKINASSFKSSEEIRTIPVKKLAKENHFKYSELGSEKPDQIEEVSTAHDFVKKLREEQGIPKPTCNTKKVNGISEPKLDSKGFRILKNQVPDFSRFTRDEVLNILKQNVVYSDDDLLVLNKPYNFVIHESQTTKLPCLSMFLDDLAKEMDPQTANPKLFTVHRLDKETTGCLLLARNETMAMNLKALFVQRKIIKKYWIITAGVPDPKEGVIDMPISEGSVNNRKRMVLHPKLPKDINYESHSKHGRPAVTSYKVISESGNAALVEVFPKTGVKHQIRVHFGFGLGCPILGDHKYSHLEKLVPQKLPSDMLQRLVVRQSKVRFIPMHIHAKAVVIPEYFERRNLFVNIPIPEYMKDNLKKLKFRKKDMIV